MATVLENHSDFVVIDKLPGLSFHSESGEAGLFEQIKRQLGASELYPVHRLDKMTSGLLLLAKNRRTAAELGQQFEQRQVEKYYLAISDKKPKKKQGLVKGDMLAARRGSYRLANTFDSPALTQFFSASMGEGRRAYLLKPHTGKTHQLRVMMKSLGAPIMGDQRYYPDCPALDRGYLHAYQISFELNGQPLRYQCSPAVGELFRSAEFNSILQQQWAQPEQLSWPNIK